MAGKNASVITIALFIIIIVFSFFRFNEKNDLPVVAIASYGPHPALEATINGVKEQMVSQGFIEGKTLHYEISHANFEPSLIPQMIAKLKNLNPKVMVVLTTPVAQFVKNKVHDIPVVYSAITDPVEAGLIKTENLPDGNMTGSSDQQDLSILLSFVKVILPDAKRIGLLYASGENNDTALLRMMRLAASSAGMSVVAIPVDQAIDIPTRMQEFNGRVDLIYTGASGSIQAALPAVAHQAQNMKIPLFNAHEQAVRSGLALASFGVSDNSVGKNSGKLVAELLRGKNINTLIPLYPTRQDHHGVINKKKAMALGIAIPENLTDVDIVS